MGEICSTGKELFISERAAEYDAVMAGISQNQLRLVGPGLVYGRLFDKIGFGAVRTSETRSSKASWSRACIVPGAS